VRVIAGRFRGHPLRAPAGARTRPTADRVREALFALLGDLAGQRVLDLFAGTGALGIEALSRGAAHATFVEAFRPARAALGQNLARLGLGDVATVLPLRVERARALLLAAAPFDLVFADPPWSRLEAACAATACAIAPPVLAPRGVVVVEHPTRAPAGALAVLGAAPFDRRTYGDTTLSLFRPAAAGAAAPTTE